MQIPRPLLNLSPTTENDALTANRFSICSMNSSSSELTVYYDVDESLLDEAHIHDSAVLYTPSTDILLPASSLPPLSHPTPQNMVPGFNGPSPGIVGVHEETKIYGLVIDLLEANTRETALLELSKKREQYDDLALVLWHSFGKRI